MTDRLTNQVMLIGIDIFTNSQEITYQFLTDGRTDIRLLELRV